MYSLDKTRSEMNVPRSENGMKFLLIPLRKELISLLIDVEATSHLRITSQKQLNRRMRPLVERLEKSTRPLAPGRGSMQ